MKVLKFYYMCTILYKIIREIDIYILMCTLYHIIIIILVFWFRFNIILFQKFLKIGRGLTSWSQLGSIHSIREKSLYITTPWVVFVYIPHRTIRRIFNTTRISFIIIETKQTFIWYHLIFLLFFFIFFLN